jgi:O-acetyl-ADP-ribose deacetylase (regulator of RNase III)
MPSFRVVHGSLTEGSEQVLVNASNTNCQLGSGVSGAIRRACGPGYQEHIVAALHARFGGPMPPGEVLLTDAGSHPNARYVAHVAVMDYRQGFHGGSFPSLSLIRKACARLWQAMEALRPPDPLSLAMVALGGGTGGLGARQPTEVACDTLAEHLGRHPETVLGRVVFYAYELPAYLAMVEVVSSRFPLEPGSVPADVQEYISKRDPAS